MNLLQNDPNNILTVVPSKYGAPMGRQTFAKSYVGKATLFRMHLVDKCYDVGGAYWGDGKMYCLTNEHLRQYIRGESWNEVRAKLKIEHDQLRVVHPQNWPDGDFLHGYIAAILFMKEYEDKEILDIPLDDQNQIVADCTNFLQRSKNSLTSESCNHKNYMERAGQCFAYTRNCSGINFSDDFKKTQAATLNKIAHNFAPYDLFLDDEDDDE